MKTAQHKPRRQASSFPQDLFYPEQRKVNPMEQKELASQLRQGNCWQYANDRAARSRDTVVRDKQTATDWELVKVASTCFFCRRSAADVEINEAMSDAHDAESFIEFIQNDIEHSLSCDYGDAVDCDPDDDGDSWLAN